jgi:hypothetical protein
VEDHGEAAVVTVFGRIHSVDKPPRDAGTYIWGAVDALEPKPNGRKPAVVVTDSATDYDSGMSIVRTAAQLAQDAAIAATARDYPPSEVWYPPVKERPQ